MNLNHLRCRLEPSSLLVASTLTFALAGALVLLTLESAHAQAAPDAGSLLRETQRPAGPTELASKPVPIDGPAPTSRDEGVQFTVKNFRLLGASLVPEHDLQLLLAPWLNRPIGFAELNRASIALVEAYRRQGWLVRVQLPKQDVTEGMVTLKLIEGRFGEVRVDSAGQTLRVHPDVLVNLLTARQQPGQAASLPSLERATNLLGDLPGVLATVALAPGSAEGLTDVLVTAQNKPPLGGLVQLDNYSTRSTGDVRLTGSVRLDSPSGWADQGQFTGQVSEGTDYARVDYSLPVGSDGLRAGVDVSGLRYHLIREFASLDAKGTAVTAGVFASYPVLRGVQRNLVANFTADTKRYRNDASGAETSLKRAEVVTLGLNGDAEDDWGHGGFTLLGANVTAGHLNLSGDAANQLIDANGPQTAGYYGKLALNVARLQRLNASSSVWVSANGQFASKNLDSSEKFALGGPNGVRAYPLLAGQGDDGWQGTIEWRQALRPELQAVAFYDYGAVRVDHRADYSGAAALRNYALQGVGAGVAWGKPGDFSVRFTLAHHVGGQPDGLDENNSYQAWASLIKFFN